MPALVLFVLGHATQGSGADAALAARIVDVRIGTHPGYTRVVFETDAPALHEIVTAPAATPGEVDVRIAAGSTARAVSGRGAGAPEVSLEPQPDGSTLARIRAEGPVRVETQVLRAPPRLVLDLRPGALAESAVAIDEPDQVAESEPASSSEVQPIPDPAASPPREPELPPRPEPAPLVEAPSAPAHPEAAPPAPAPLPQTTPKEPEAAPLPPPPPVVVVPLPRGVVVDAPTPPVASPPPAAIAFDSRSLAVGAALGVAIALLGFAVRRSDRGAVTEATAPEPIEADAKPVEDVETLPIGAEEPRATDAAPPAPEAATDPETVADWFRIHRQIETRLANIAARLEVVATRQADLDRREGAQTHEIAAQRVAIARLQRALRPPLRPRKTEKDAG